MFEAIKGKKALVTGATSGIGSAIALLLAEHGASVGVHYRSDRRAALRVAEAARELSGEAEAFHGDLLKRGSAEELVDSFVHRFGGIDILVNNAGGYEKHAHFMDIDEDSWDKSYALNAKAPFLVMRRAFASMKRRKWGRIVNISTNAIKFVGPSSLYYTSAKSALDTLTRGFAREGAQHNILVNSIRCGVIDTSMRDKLQGYDEKAFRARVKLVPLKRAGSALDIARMALFLASECGDYITGEIISVAGGD